MSQSRPARYVEHPITTVYAVSCGMDELVALMEPENPGLAMILQSLSATLCDAGDRLEQLEALAKTYNEGIREAFGEGRG